MARPDSTGFGFLAAIGAGLVVLVSAAGCRKAAAPAQPAAAAAAVPVVATPVLVRDTTNYVESVGQTAGGRDVEIRARVAGFLESMHFTEGRPVASNDLLYVIDDRPFKAALAQAEGTLAQVTAAWEKSRRDTNRLGPLWEKNAISRQQYDDAVASERSAAANVQAAQAAAETARIQLGYTRIHSPVDGIAGKNEVGLGNLVGQGQNTLLTTVSDIRTINVRFSISETEYLAYKNRQTAESDAEGVGAFELILADGSVHPHRNSTVFADRQVDPRTGTLLLQVGFPNPEQIVRPGQFARVRFPADVMPQAILVPRRAVMELQANYSVYVVGEGDVAGYRRVTLGPTVGALQVVAAGLKAGDRVVVDGHQKLQDGVPMSVTLTNLAAGAAAAGSGAAAR